MKSPIPAAEFAELSRVLRLNSPASLSPQNSVSRTTVHGGVGLRYAF